MYLRAVPKTWILYGASGETGQFVSTHAVALGLQPTLAGRDPRRLEPLANRLGLDHQVAELDDPDAVDELLRDATLVVNCAGPFATTARPLVDACLRTHTHYVDIGNELLTLREVLERDAEARASEVLLLPGAGFEVIPSDCVARRLHEELPQGDRLELGIRRTPLATPGMVASMLAMLSLGPLVRRGGELVRLSAPALRSLAFGRRRVPCVSLPWPDLVSAYASTQIPNITVYVEAIEHHGEPVTDYDRLAALLRASLELPQAPASGRGGVWARLTSRSGDRAEATLDLPDPLAFTATATCEIVCRILEGELGLRVGASTPSALLGSSFVLDLPGVGGFGLRREIRGA